jgi:hypothetical protein
MFSSLNHSKIFRSILAVVYAAFFAVQLFFNFSIRDFQKHAKQVIVTQHVQKIPAKKSAVLTFTQKNDCNSSQLRLNKRFQPNSIEFIPLAIENDFVCYATEKQDYFYYQSPLFYSSSEAHFLRGPPVVTASMM